MMDKETTTALGPPTPDGILGPAEKASAADAITASKTSDESKVHEFNEQTNYVPKRTIITVGCLALSCALTKRS